MIPTTAGGDNELLAPQGVNDRHQIEGSDETDLKRACVFYCERHRSFLVAFLLLVIADIGYWVSQIATFNDNDYYDFDRDHLYTASCLFLTNDCIILLTTIFLIYLWHYNININNNNNNISPNNQRGVIIFIGLLTLLLHTIGVIYWFKKNIHNRFYSLN